MRRKHAPGARFDILIEELDGQQIGMNQAEAVQSGRFTGGGK